jgi:hypothetical protein
MWQRLYICLGCYKRTWWAASGEAAGRMCADCDGGYLVALGLPERWVYRAV